MAQLLHMWIQIRYGCLRKTCTRSSPLKLPIWMGERLTESHPSQRNYWQLTVASCPPPSPWSMATVCCLCPRAWRHIQAYMGSPNWTQWFVNLKNKKKVRERTLSLEGDTLGEPRRKWSREWLGGYNQRHIYTYKNKCKMLTKKEGSLSLCLA